MGPISHLAFPDATLLLIGHGSTVNGDSGATVHQHVAELRRRNLFADVQPAFFKIEPRIGPALASIRTPRVFVVPLFVSEGYFTRQAIPCELGLPAGSQDVMPCKVRLEDRDVIYCHPVGTHPLMTEIILSRAWSVLRACRASDVASAPHPVPLPIGWGEGARRAGEGTPETQGPSTQSLLDTALVIAGHGTALNPDSRKSIERQVELIAARNLFAEVYPAFLEEPPLIAEIPSIVKSTSLVMVPFFMSDGLHVCEDIPVLLGESEATVQARLQAGQWPWHNPTDIRGRRIYYTPGVGSEPGIADVILERVNAAANL